MQTILAGDIGGTSTRLALYAVGVDAQVPLRAAVFASRDFGGLAQLCQQFLQPSDQVTAAAFGVAGPVVDGRCVTTNLPWVVDPAELAQAIGCEQVRLLNDLEALALGSLHVPQDARVVLQPGIVRDGHIAVLAAGTGLGQAQLFWDGQRHLAGATEGGHVEFAPADADDEALLHFVRHQLQADGQGSHVSWERLVSGPGLGLIAQFLYVQRGLPLMPDVVAQLGTPEAGAAVGQAGAAGTCATSVQAVRWFARLYARQAGNWALSLLSLGGVVLGGGIAPKILPFLQEPAVLDAFADKGRYQGLMRTLPLTVITDPLTGLYGARVCAQQLAQQRVQMGM